MKDDQPTLIPYWLRQHWRAVGDYPVSLDAVRRLQRGMDPADDHSDPNDQEIVYEDPRDFRGD